MFRKKNKVESKDKKSEKDKTITVTEPSELDNKPESSKNGTQEPHSELEFIENNTIIEKSKRNDKLGSQQNSTLTKTSELDSKLGSPQSSTVTKTSELDSKLGSPENSTLTKSSKLDSKLGSAQNSTLTKSSKLDSKLGSEQISILTKTSELDSKLGSQTNSKITVKPLRYPTTYPETSKTDNASNLKKCIQFDRLCNNDSSICIKIDKPIYKQQQTLICTANKATQKTLCKTKCNPTCIRPLKKKGTACNTKIKKPSRPCNALGGENVIILEYECCNTKSCACQASFPCWKPKIKKNKKKKKKKKKVVKTPSSDSKSDTSSSSFDDRPVLNSLTTYTNHVLEFIMPPVFIQPYVSQNNLGENCADNNMECAVGKCKPESSTSYIVCSSYSNKSSTTDTSTSSTSSTSSSSSSSNSSSSSTSIDLVKNRRLGKVATQRTEHLSKKDPVANYIKNLKRRRRR